METELFCEAEVFWVEGFVACVNVWFIIVRLKEGGLNPSFYFIEEVSESRGSDGFVGDVDLDVIDITMTHDCWMKTWHHLLCGAVTVLKTERSQINVNGKWSTSIFGWCLFRPSLPRPRILIETTGEDQKPEEIIFFFTLTWNTWEQSLSSSETLRRIKRSAHRYSYRPHQNVNNGDIHFLYKVQDLWDSFPLGLMFL